MYIISYRIVMSFQKYDACHLMKDYDGPKVDILIDQVCFAEAVYRVDYTLFLCEKIFLMKCRTCILNNYYEHTTVCVILQRSRVVS